MNDEFIVWTELDYRPEQFGEAVNGWVKVVEATDANEPQVGVNYCLGERDKSATGRMIEAYESEKFIANLRRKSKVVLDGVTKKEMLRVGEAGVVLL